MPPKANWMPATLFDLLTRLLKRGSLITGALDLHFNVGNVFDVLGVHQYLIVNDLARRVGLGVPRYFGVQRFHIVDAHHNAGSERIIVVGGGINDTHHRVWHGNGGTLTTAGIGWRHGSAAHLVVVVGTLIVGSGNQRDFGVQHIEERSSPSDWAQPCSSQ